MGGWLGRWVGGRVAGLDRFYSPLRPSYRMILSSGPSVAIINSKNNGCGTAPGNLVHLFTSDKCIFLHNKHQIIKVKDKLWKNVLLSCNLLIIVSIGLFQDLGL